MSTLKKTDNYDLTKYEGITYPLFLGDFGDNMDIIDRLIKSINDDIADIQRVIDTVSTQNIDDLLARLMALEVKVDNNAGMIEGLLTNLNNLNQIVGRQNNKIADIVNELNAAKADIDALKTKCDQCISILNEHTSQIAENSTAIENINNNINRIREDVIGNAQDIQTLATQIRIMAENKQDKLQAGAGIDITDNVISVTGAGNVVGTYDATSENLTLG